MPQEANPTALIVIDVQLGFDSPQWGKTVNQPGCEHNIAALVDHWLADRPGPLVLVRHDSPKAGSPLAPGSPGNRLMGFLDGVKGDLLVAKSVNSAFYGQPDLHAWLRSSRVEDLVVCGIQTNMCVETTARMAGNLGYRVTVPLDATRTFDIVADIPGIGRRALSAEQAMSATAVNLQAGGFAQVTTTAQVLA